MSLSSCRRVASIYNYVRFDIASILNMGVRRHRFYANLRKYKSKYKLLEGIFMPMPNRTNEFNAMLFKDISPAHDIIYFM